MRIVRIVMNIACLLAICGLSWASPVDSVTACKVAARFYQMKAHSSMPVSQPVKVYTHYAPSDNSSETVPVFHVYNVDNGFVMVATDNRLRPVIAYSTEGPFMVDQISPAMMDILDDYAAEIKDYLEQQTTAVESPMWRDILEMRRLGSRNEVVIPALLGTSWDQNRYYNSFCPVDDEGPGGHALAGCVATAMAQVIKYWEYPAQGTGSHSYNSDYGVLSADFGNTTYSYALMPGRLTSNTPDDQVQEVAKLIYHCGVSVDMIYGSNTSGAYISDIPNAAHTYFGYGNSSYIEKINYSASEWDSIIKSQLVSLRPVIYRGESNASGHAFVCDGYDEQNYFHFNWGWGGSNNGYFQMSNLTPGNHNYSYYQGAIINLFVDRPMIKTATTPQILYSLDGAADTTQIRVISVNGGDQVLASVTGDFTISDGTTPFGSTAVLQSGNQFLYVRFQDASAESATHHGTVTLSYDSVTTTIDLRGEALTVHHEAPQNPIAIKQAPSNVHLTWDPPAVGPQTYICGESTFQNCYGAINDYSMALMHRLCDTDLVALYPAQLTHITFYLRAGVTNCELLVYKGGSYDSYTLFPGEKVLHQPMDRDQLNGNAWNTVELETPIPITLGEELWYGIYIEAPGGSYSVPAGIAPNYEPEKGNIVGEPNTNNDNASWSFYNKNRNFSIQAQFQSLSNTVDHYRITRDSLVRGTTTQLYFDDEVPSPGDYAYHIAAVYMDSAVAEATTSLYVHVKEECALPAICYPNPVQDIFHVEGVSCDQLLLYDMNGHLCRSWEGRREDWSVSVRHLSNGTYLLVGMADGKRQFVTRVVVQH
jgi:hypothetical protein